MTGVHVRGFGDTAPGATILFENLTVTNCRDEGVALEKNAAPGGVIFRDAAVSGADRGYRVLNGAGPSIVGGTVSGIEQAILLERGGSGLTLDGVTVTGRGVAAFRAGALPPRYLGADSILIRNAVFNGGGAETAVHLIRSVAVRFENTTVTNYKTGLYLENTPGVEIVGGEITQCETGVWAVGASWFARARSVTPSFVHLDDATVDSWIVDGGDDAFDIGRSSPIGFAFPVAGRVFAHQNLGENGDLLLFEAPDWRESVINGNPALSPQGGRPAVLDEEPYVTAVFTLADDLTTNVSINDSGFGWKLFGPGDPDADGVLAAETVFVASWHGSTDIANETGLPAPSNRVQTLLYPDGRVQWNLERVRSRFHSSGPYSGISSGEAFEIFADVLTRTDPTASDSRSFLWNPADSFFPLLVPAVSDSIAVTGSAIRGATIRENTTGIFVDSGHAVRIVGARVEKNGVGIRFATHSESYIVTQSDFLDNTTWDIENGPPTTVDATGNFFFPSAKTAGAVNKAGQSQAPLTLVSTSVSTSGQTGCIAMRVVGSGPMLGFLRGMRDAALSWRVLRPVVAWYYNM